MRRFVIMDLAGIGHHPSYVRWTAEAASASGAEVVVAGLPELVNHSELNSLEVSRFEVRLSAAQELALSDFSSSYAFAKREFVMRELWGQVCRELVKSCEISDVILPCADDSLHAIGILGSPFEELPWYGITLRPSFHFKETGILAPPGRLPRINQWAFRRALRSKSLGGICTIDPTLCGYADSHFTLREREKLVFLPDPAVEHRLRPKAEALQMLHIPAGASVVLCYGDLSQRKGIEELIRGASDPSVSDNLHVVLAGKQSEFCKSLLGAEMARQLRSKRRLHDYDGYQDDEAEATLLSAADVMWIGYVGFFMMSGVLVKACRHGIPCVVSEQGLAGHLTKQRGLGWVIDPTDPESVVGALRSVCSDEEALVKFGENARLGFREHSVRQFQRTIQRLLTRALPESARDCAIKSSGGKH